MTEKEKAEKYDKILAHFWRLAFEGTWEQSCRAVALLHYFEMKGPKGENLEDAEEESLAKVMVASVR